MIRILSIIFIFSSSMLCGDVICSNDSSFQLDNRYSFLEEVNPTYGDTIYTGSCACIDFSPEIDVNGETVTFTLKLLDNEPVSGFMFDLYTNVPELSFLSIVKGEKIQNVYNNEGSPLLIHQYLVIG